MHHRRVFDLKPTLENALVKLRPLAPSDFEPLFAVASDPLIWAQHPTKERYRREEFTNYFDTGIASGGALLILDGQGKAIGSSRYYGFDDVERTVAIGYTFFARRCWGKGHNQATKALMMSHAFRFVSRILFHVGRDNKRSRIAMERLGGVLVGEIEMAYQGEPRANVNVVYAIERPGADAHDETPR